MATIKSYTDIEQSKMLTEILQIESADMHYNNGSCRGVDYTEHFNAELMPYQEALHLMKIHKTNFMFQVIPCWSLTALLKYLSEVKSQVYTPILFPSEDKWTLHFVEYGHGNICEVSCDNPVDACVEMILKLKELKLI